MTYISLNGADTLKYSLPNRLLNNYIVWKTVEEYATYLSWEYVYALRQWLEMRTGEKEFAPTWELCLGLVQKNMAFGLAGELAQTHSQQDRRQMVCEEIHNYVLKLDIYRLTDLQVDQCT